MCSCGHQSVLSKPKVVQKISICQVKVTKSSTSENCTNTIRINGKAKLEYETGTIQCVVVCIHFLQLDDFIGSDVINK